MFNITAYTDGASSGNPGPSGYGAILINEATGAEREISEPVCHATGNMAELMAVRGAMWACKSPNKTNLTIYTDSQYAMGVCSGKFRPKTNVYLISTIKKIMHKFHNIEWVHVRGHNGDAINERVDRLAKKAAQEAKNDWKPVCNTKSKVVGFIKSLPYEEAML